MTAMTQDKSSQTKQPEVPDSAPIPHEPEARICLRCMGTGEAMYPTSLREGSCEYEYQPCRTCRGSGRRL